MAYINTDIPIFSAYLDTSFLYNEDTRKTNEFINVEVFGFTSLSFRCGLFSVMTEMGSIHTRVPIHYLTNKLPEEKLTNFPLDWLQLWDAFSPHVSVNKYEYLKHSACKILLKDKTWHQAKYLMTFDWVDSQDHQATQSEDPGNHKQGHLLVGEGGQFFCQPGNRIVWRDGGDFICKELNGHDKWEVFNKEFSCKHAGSRWFAGEEELYFYQFEPNKDKS